MPCAQFEALEQIRQAQHDRGVDSDKSTIEDENNNDAEDEGDPQGEPALLETRICKPLWTYSRESFSSAREWRKPSTMTK